MCMHVYMTLLPGRNVHKTKTFCRFSISRRRKKAFGQQATGNLRWKTAYGSRLKVDV